MTYHQCDESRPSCGNCLKHRKAVMPCVFDYEAEAPMGIPLEFLNPAKGHFNSSSTHKTYEASIVRLLPAISPVVGSNAMDPFMTYPSSKVSDVHMLTHHCKYIFANNMCIALINFALFMTLLTLSI